MLSTRLHHYILYRLFCAISITAFRATGWLLRLSQYSLHQHLVADREGLIHYACWRTGARPNFKKEDIYHG